MHRAERPAKVGSGLGSRGDRLQSSLDAVDFLGRLPAAVVDRIHCDGSEGGALKAGEVAAPEDSIPSGGRQDRKVAGCEAGALFFGIVVSGSESGPGSIWCGIVSSNRKRAASARGDSFETVWPKSKG